jgi:hypothetical protein
MALELIAQSERPRSLNRASPNLTSCKYQAYGRVTVAMPTIPSATEDRMFVKEKSAPLEQHSYPVTSQVPLSSLLAGYSSDESEDNEEEELAKSPIRLRAGKGLDSCERTVAQQSPLPAASFDSAVLERLIPSSISTAASFSPGLSRATQRIDPLDTPEIFQSISPEPTHLADAMARYDKHPQGARTIEEQSLRCQATPDIQPPNNTDAIAQGKRPRQASPTPVQTPPLKRPKPNGPFLIDSDSESSDVDNARTAPRVETKTHHRRSQPFPLQDHARTGTDDHGLGQGRGPSTGIGTRITHESITETHERNAPLQKRTLLAPTCSSGSGVKLNLARLKQVIQTNAKKPPVVDHGPVHQKLKADQEVASDPTQKPIRDRPNPKTKVALPVLLSDSTKIIIGNSCEMQTQATNAQRAVERRTMSGEESAINYKASANGRVSVSAHSLQKRNMPGDSTSDSRKKAILSSSNKLMHKTFEEAQRRAHPMSAREKNEDVHDLRTKHPPTTGRPSIDKISGSRESIQTPTLTKEEKLVPDQRKCGGKTQPAIADSGVTEKKTLKVTESRNKSSTGVCKSTQVLKVDPQRSGKTVGNTEQVNTRAPQQAVLTHSISRTRDDEASLLKNVSVKKSTPSHDAAAKVGSKAPIASPRQHEPVSARAKDTLRAPTIPTACNGRSRSDLGLVEDTRESLMPSETTASIHPDARPFNAPTQAVGAKTPQLDLNNTSTQENDTSRPGNADIPNDKANDTQPGYLMHDRENAPQVSALEVVYDAARSSRGVSEVSEEGLDLTPTEIWKLGLQLSQHQGSQVAPDQVSENVPVQPEKRLEHHVTWNSQNIQEGAPIDVLNRKDIDTAKEETNNPKLAGRSDETSHVELPKESNTLVEEKNFHKDDQTSTVGETSLTGCDSGIQPELPKDMNMLREPIPVAPEGIVIPTTEVTAPTEELTTVLPRQVSSQSPTSQATTAVISDSQEPASFFEFTIYRKLYTSTDDLTVVPSCQVLPRAFTSIEEANAAASALIDTTHSHPTLYGIQTQSWHLERDQHDCLTFHTTFLTSANPSSTHHHEIWVQRTLVSRYENRLPEPNTPFINKAVYILRLSKLIQPDVPSRSRSRSRSRSSSSSTTSTSRTPTPTPQPTPPIKSHEPLPPSFSELHTTLNSANRCARNLQIHLSHRKDAGVVSLSQAEKLWQEDDNRKLYEKVHALDPGLPGGKEGCWESVFNGLGGERFELVVGEVRLCGPRNF